ncbi:MAG: UDP-N-acetylmuramate dehydrogenase [Reichenbachiella sp.]
MSIVKESISLKDYNSFGMDVHAKYFSEVSDIQSVRDVLLWSKNEKTSILIIGGGSNVLLTENIDGLVIKNSLLGKDILSETKEDVTLKVGAGEVWHDLVIYCVSEGFGGIENLSLIPGSVGAAPMQNIGAYGVEIKDVFVSLQALNLETLEIETFSREECEFGYRESIFKKKYKGQYFITSVILKLSKKHRVNTSYGAINEVLITNGISEPSIKDVSEAVVEIRKSKLPDPTIIGNSGSFFKNPVVEQSQYDTLKRKYEDMPSYSQLDGRIKIPAGWLIEQCGWKGIRRGDIGVHDKQALVLVNHGGGKGEAIRQLAKDIQLSVEEKFDIELETEVNII